MVRMNGQNGTAIESDAVDGSSGLLGTEDPSLNSDHSTGHASLVSSEKGSKVTFSNGLDPTLSKALEDVAEKLGIESLPGNYISIPMGDNLKLKARDITVDGDDKNVVNKTLGVLKANLKDLQTTLESLWKNFLEAQRTAKAFDLYGKDYWYKKGLFFKKLFSQPDAVLSLMKPLNITDEHEFLISGTASLIDSPELFKVDPKLLEMNAHNGHFEEHNLDHYVDHLVVLFHGYGPNTVTTRGLRNNILTLFSNTVCEVIVAEKDDYDKPIDELAKRVADVVAQRLATSEGAKVDKITIMAHSLGGLLARAAVLHLGDEHLEKLHALVTIGTPHLGYPDMNVPDGSSASLELSLRELSQGKVALPGDGLVLDLSNVDESVILDVSDEGASKPKRTLTPKDDHKVTQVTYQERCLWTSSDPKEHCKYVWLYYDKETKQPTSAAIKFVDKDGEEKLKFATLWPANWKGMCWTM